MSITAATTAVAVDKSETPHFAKLLIEIAPFLGGSMSTDA